ncbi:MAG TPA: pilus assembly protein PilM [Phycisphaerae bacterium]|nr:pilus assembly protein PilM [Phycisphaerae bacterium]
MKPFTTGRRSPIGVDFDGRFMRAVQLTKARDGWRLEAGVSAPRTSPDAPMDGPEVKEFHQVLRRQNFKGTRVVLAVPEEKLVADLLELPPRSSGAPLDEIARAELASAHAYDPAEAETVCWDLPPSARVKDMTNVMAVACRHADAQALLEAFESAGLAVGALSSRLHAVVRAVRPMLWDSGMTAILDFGWDSALLLLMHQGTVIYRRTMPEAAVRLLLQAVSKSLDLEDDAANYLLADVGLAPDSEEAKDEAPSFKDLTTLISKHLEVVVEAMRSAFSYAAQLYPDATAVEYVLLTGQGSGIPGFYETLLERLGMSVRVTAPVDVLEGPSTRDGPPGNPSLTVATGLAQYAGWLAR